jgi:hypothetical protein
MRIRSLSASEYLLRKARISCQVLHVLVAQLLHQLASFFVTDGEVRHLKATPASLALG